MWRNFIIKTSKPLSQSKTDLLKWSRFSNLAQQNFSTKTNIPTGLYRPNSSLIFRGISSSQSFYATEGSKIPVGSDKPELPKFEKEKYGEKPKQDTRLFNIIGVFLSGAIAYFGISYGLEYKKRYAPAPEINYSSKHLPGSIKPSKSVVRENNPGNIKLTLYQFTTCPFCCKVRAYLDYFGYSYDIVEVNSLTKKQLDWSPAYKGVPVVAVQVPSKENPEEYEKEIVQLNDSSVIVSALETYRLDPSHSLHEIVRYFDPVEFDSDKGGKKEYANRYFVMLYNESVKEGKSNSERKLEREWRSWVDKKFVHVISPNCYRTLSEAIETFNWFDKAGNWEKEFNNFERSMMIYIGAFVMFIIAKRLKKKYELKENVRDSFDECSEEWTSTIESKHPFKGGAKPNLADLAYYGSIGSFEGTQAFDDMIKHEKLKSWFDAMKEMVTNSKGVVYLNNMKVKN